MYILFCWKTAEEHLEPMAGNVYHASWSLVLVACGPLSWPATYAQILDSLDVQHQSQARKHTGPSDSCLVTTNDIRPHPSCQKLVQSHWWMQFLLSTWLFRDSWQIPVTFEVLTKKSLSFGHLRQEGGWSAQVLVDKGIGPPNPRPGQHAWLGSKSKFWWLKSLFHCVP